jgi:hypothetical protein
MKELTGSYSKAKAKWEKMEKYEELAKKIWEAIGVCTFQNEPEKAAQWLDFYNLISRHAEE